MDLFQLRGRLRGVSDSWRLDGRPVGTPRRAHRCADLVVPVHGIDRTGCHVAVGGPLRHRRRVDGCPVRARRRRSGRAPLFQSRRGQLDAGRVTWNRHRSGDRRHWVGLRHHAADCGMGHGELAMADRLLSVRRDRPRHEFALVVGGARSSRSPSLGPPRRCFEAFSRTAATAPIRSMAGVRRLSDGLVARRQLHLPRIRCLSVSVVVLSLSGQCPGVRHAAGRALRRHPVPRHARRLCHRRLGDRPPGKIVRRHGGQSDRRPRRHDLSRVRHSARRLRRIALRRDRESLARRRMFVLHGRRLLELNYRSFEDSCRHLVGSHEYRRQRRRRDLADPDAVDREPVGLAGFAERCGGCRRRGRPAMDMDQAGRGTKKKC